MRFLALLAIMACDGAADDGACEYPDAYQPVTGTLEAGDTCRAWSLPVDEHLTVNVAVTVPDDGSLPECEANEVAGLELWSSPIYSNLADQGAKWTFDWVGVAEAEAEEIVVTCTDGSTWSAMIEVTP